MGSDLDAICNAGAGAVVSIHAPRMGSDRLPHKLSHNCHSFNPRSPHGERLVNAVNKTRTVYVSIHAPRMGSDYTEHDSGIIEYAVSIHAPRMGSDCFVHGSPYHQGCFNPRSPHGERRLTSSCRELVHVVSIHAPRMGSDERF